MGWVPSRLTKDSQDDLMYPGPESPSWARPGPNYSMLGTMEFDFDPPSGAGALALPSRIAPGAPGVLAEEPVFAGETFAGSVRFLVGPRRMGTGRSTFHIRRS